MERFFKKLVRDKIPDIIRNNNEIPVIKTLSDIEYKAELEKKLYEEYQEVIGAETKEERIEELADMLEIINSLAKIEGSSLTDVIKTADEKREERGGFDDRVFLEKKIFEREK